MTFTTRNALKKANKIICFQESSF